MIFKFRHTNSDLQECTQRMAHFKINLKCRFDINTNIFEMISASHLTLYGLKLADLTKHPNEETLYHHIIP